MEQPATRERGDFRGSAGDEPASPERARHGRVSWESQSAPPLSLAFRAAFQRRREKERKHRARWDSGSRAPLETSGAKEESVLLPFPPARRLLPAPGAASEASCRRRDGIGPGSPFRALSAGWLNKEALTAALTGGRADPPSMSPALPGSEVPVRPWSAHPQVLPFPRPAHSYTLREGTGASAIRNR